MLMALALSLLAERTDAPDCFETARDIAIGELLSPDAVKPVACRTSSTAHSLRYDASNRTILAFSALPAGTYLGPLFGVESDITPAGTKLTLRAVAGPAIVERGVVSLQPGRSGRAVFVRDADGNVFAALLEVER